MKERLGDPTSLPSVDQGQTKAVKIITDRLEELKREEEQRAKAQLKKLEDEKARQQQAYKVQQKQLDQQQRERQAKEAAERLARFRKGILGFVDWISGRKAKIEKINIEEASKALQRDQYERQTIASHMKKIDTLHNKKAQSINSNASKYKDVLQSEISALMNIKKRENYIRHQKEVSSKKLARSRQEGKKFSPQREP